MNIENDSSGVYNVTTNIKDLCRLCLSINNAKESLYSPLEEIFEDDVTTLFRVMEKLSLTKLSTDPRYPSYLCTNCVSLLNTAYQVNRLLEISQSRLSALIKEEFPVNKPRANITSNVVEIISEKGKYNLKDILIVEENEQQPVNYDGFLGNLGSVISANFVPINNSNKRKCRDNEIHTVNLIPLSKISDEPAIHDDRSTATELECAKKKLKSPKLYTKSKPLMCNHCNKIFKSKQCLFRHKELHGVKSYLCQICGYVTNRRYALGNHMLIKHHGKRFACEVCGKKYLSNTGLQCHVAIHKDERLHLCTVCGKSFNYASSLIYHMRIHTGEKKYKCTYCGRAFSMRCGLNRHLRTHTGLRPYKCSFCEKSFRSKGEVNCHEMTHTGYRPYHCKLCGKGFTKTHNLKVHMLGHRGPFCCQFCQKGFAETAYLKMHMKMYHGLDDDNADEEHILIVQGEDLELEGFNDNPNLTPEENL